MPRLPIPEKIAQGVKDEKKDVDKDLAVQFLTETFRFCNDAVASMTPEKKQLRVERLRATRAARHTMGKRQKQDVKGVVNPDAPPASSAPPGGAGPGSR